jgi:hypothetical protein
MFPHRDLFKNMAEVVRESGVAAEAGLLIKEEKPRPRRNNAPTADEICFLMSDTLTASKRDNVIRTPSELEHISELHRHYDALHYLLMFPHGDAGWTIDTRSKGRRITTMNWYSYRLMIRDDGHDLHLFERLFQQYIVDTYAKMSRVDYDIHVSANQNNLRTEMSQQVFTWNISAVNIGKKTAEEPPLWHSVHVDIPFEVSRIPGMFSTANFAMKALVVNLKNMWNGSIFSVLREPSPPVVFSRLTCASAREEA